MLQKIQARPTTSGTFLTADNVGDTIDYIQHARPNLRAVFGHAVVPAVEEVHGVIESLFHVGSTTNIRIDGALHVIRSGTPVTVTRAAGRPSVIFPPALERTVRPITPKIPLAEYISPAVPVPTSLRPGTIIDSYAGDVDSDDVGHQVSFAVGDVEVFGTLERVMPGTLSRTVALTVDGTVFDMPSGKPVTVTVARLKPAAPTRFYTR